MSSRNGPIIIIEDDPDDQEILREVCHDLKVQNELKFFHSTIDAFYYLMDTRDKPMLILSDVNVPGMTGLEMRRKINEHDHLRRKCIPFVFLTTSSKKEAVEYAYEMMVQGYFEKPNSMDQLKSIIKMIMDYWLVCKHPNAD